MPPGEGRRVAIEQRQPRTGGLADPRWVERTLDTAWEKLHCLAAWGYPFPNDDEGRPYLANLRGPDYMHFMRRRVLAAGVTILDHHPALELLGDGETIAGAAGIDRQRNRPCGSAPVPWFWRPAAAPSASACWGRRRRPVTAI